MPAVPPASIAPARLPAATLLADAEYASVPLLAHVPASRSSSGDCHSPFGVRKQDALAPCFLSSPSQALPFASWLCCFCTTWDAKIPVNNGINYQPQLVNAGFLNHQQ